MKVLSHTFGEKKAYNVLWDKILGLLGMLSSHYQRFCFGPNSLVYHSAIDNWGVACQRPVGYVSVNRCFQGAVLHDH